MRSLKQILIETYGITNPKHIQEQEVPSENKAQAFTLPITKNASESLPISVQDLLHNTIQRPQLKDIKNILEAVLTGEKEFDDCFDSLESPSEHFSLQVSKQNPNIIIASSAYPLSIIAEKYFLLHDAQIAIFEADDVTEHDATLKIIATETHAFAMGICNSKIETYQVEFPAIPQFQLNAPTWLLPSLQGQDRLIKKAIAFGDISRFEEMKLDVSQLNKEDFLAQLQSPRTQFSWETLHPFQKKLLIKHFYSWVDNLMERTRLILTTEEALEEEMAQWLQERDQLQSFLCVLQHYYESSILLEKINRLDSSFPHAKTSHILPQNRRLAEAFSKDPSCWWGKSSKMRRLYDQLSGTQA